MGRRTRSACIEKMNPGMTEAAASDVNPMSNLRPLIAMTAVQTLCSTMNMKLVRERSQEVWFRVPNRLVSVSGETLT